MKKFFSYILALGLLMVSCTNSFLDAVPVLPELHSDYTEVALGSAEGSTITSLLLTTVGDISAEYDCSWLDVQVSNYSAVFTTLAANTDAIGLRETTVTLVAGSYTLEIPVSQKTPAIEAAEVVIDYDDAVFVGYPNETALELYTVSPDGNGFIFWVDPNDNTSGKAIWLSAEKAAPSADDDSEFGASSTYHGVSNTHKFPKASNVITYSAALGDSWYIPAFDELVDFFGVYNGIHPDDDGFSYNIHPNSITADEYACREAFENAIQAVGGAMINTEFYNSSSNGDGIISSTEGSTTSTVKYVRFGAYNPTMTRAKTSASSYIRPFQIIGSHEFVEPVEEYYITPGESELNIAQEMGSSATTTIETNTEAVTSSTDVDWLFVQATTESLLVMASSANDTGEDRTATVTIASGSAASTTVTVTQTYIPSTPTVYETVEGYPNTTALSIGDLSPDGKGIVFWVDPTDNTNGKALSIDCLSGLAFDSSASYIYGAYDEEKGFDNTDLIVAYGTATNPISLIESLGDHWYIPAQNELIAVFEAYNGTSADDATVATPDSITDAEKAARDTFDSYLTAQGGRAINTSDASASGDSYWSSTEGSSGTMVAIRFGTYGNLGGMNKTKTTRLIRAVQIIGSVQYEVEE